MLSGKHSDFPGQERGEGHGSEHPQAGEFGQRPFEGRVLPGLALAVGPQDQQPGGWLVAGDVAEQVQAGRVCPLEVVEDEE